MSKKAINVFGNNLIRHRFLPSAFAKASADRSVEMTGSGVEMTEDACRGGLHALPQAGINPAPTHYNRKKM